MAEYTPPTGSVTLNIGGDPLNQAGVANLYLDLVGPDREAAIVATAAAPRAAVVIQQWAATIAARTAAPRAVGVLHHRFFAALAATTAAPRANINGAYDPNLLSAVHQVRDNLWQEGALALAGATETTQQAAWLCGAGHTIWADAPLQLGAMQQLWQQSEFAAGAGIAAWQDATSINADSGNHWQDATHLDATGGGSWQDGRGECFSAENHWQDALRLDCGRRDGWTQGDSAAQGFRDRAGDGLRIEVSEIEVWQQAGYPDDAANRGQPPPPEPPPPTRNLILNLSSALQSLPLVLNLGYGWPAWNVYDRRYYAVLNTCSVVRLPDRTELPVTAVSVETDCDSWAWSVSLSLAGPDAWALCRPNPLPIEVEISINGHLWTALLDDPQLSRGFNSNRISAKGMSRSAWLTAPYTPSWAVTHYAPRTAQQIAESIVLDNGWTLDWQLPQDPQWLIPARHYARTGTPIQRLVELVGAVKGCLYSHPSAYAFTAYPRYPDLPWNWPAAQIDVSLPESALLSWNQTNQDRPSLNRVYVSGTTAGVLFELTKAGTAGELSPSEPIVESLLTDSYAARHRAEMELAGAGPGYEVSVETILGGTANIPLVRPGLMCEFAGILGIVRSTSINVARNGGGLAVRQGLKLERRVGPWR